MMATADLEIRALRAALSKYASGVTIVAGLHDGEPVGFTCQSFYSVSMEPPLVSFCVMQNSTTYPRIRQTGRFSVNVLSYRQHGISNQFAQKGTDKWRGIEWSPTALGNPIIADTLMWLDCGIESEHQAGDHWIVIGRVRGMSPDHYNEGTPLLYFKGQYRHLRELDTSR
jgi:3-hydroxy-9,10-secoandrosta-1,3,5(10)-triene-9,17-dione monooxygenase reductase component